LSPAAPSLPDSVAPATPPGPRPDAPWTSLPPLCADVLSLRKIACLTQAEIAIRLGLAPAEVEALIAHGARYVLSRSGRRPAAAPLTRPRSGP
jgi:hypothetical protein